jgi:hypothetical protein
VRSIKEMILDLLADENQEISMDFTEVFSKVNFVRVDAERPLEAQVSQIEERLGEPFLQSMLIYSDKYDVLGTVLSRRYVNAAKIHKGPLRLIDMTLLPDHLSSLPNNKEKNRVLFLAPHFDEAYLAAVLLHKLIGDDVFLHSFTYPREEEKSIRRAYQILGLKKDDYSLGALKVNKLFEEKKAIKETIRGLLDEFKPTAVFSVFPKGANFDHMAVAQVAKEVVLNESTADLIYGYVIQSRNRNPQIFPLFSKAIYGIILQAFGRQGLGKMFQKYLPFLRHYMETYSEPLLRMIGDKRLSDVYSLPLEAERIAKYKIPNILNHRNLYEEKAVL